MLKKHLAARGEFPDASIVSSILSNDNGQRCQTKTGNESDLKRTFEDQILLLAFLSLQENQELGHEPVKDGFYDVVLRLLKTCPETTYHKYDYFLHQLRYEAVEKKQSQSITWNDLLGNESHYSLNRLYQSFRKIHPTILENLKEVSVVTTRGFLVPPNRDPIAHDTFPVSEKDLNHYFKELDRASWNPLGLGRRYQLNANGILFFKNSLRAFTPSSPEVTVTQEFLKLLVFDINQPHVPALKNINESIVKIMFPFYWDLHHEINRFEHVQNMVLKLLKPATFEDVAQWIPASKRTDMWNDLTAKFKEEVRLGSVTGYESNVLHPLSNRLKIRDTNHSLLRKSSPWLNEIKENLAENDVDWEKVKSRDIINIFSKVNATVSAMKFYTLMAAESLKKRFLIVQVNEEKCIQRIIDHLQKLTSYVPGFNKLIRETFCLAFEVSPLVRCDKRNGINKLVRFISSSNDLRKWIQFVVITQNATHNELPVNAINLKFFEDIPLNWDDLPLPTKDFLFEKKLLLSQENRSLNTSLKALGFQLEKLGHSIDPLFLSELIIHDEMTQLHFPLPSYDVRLGPMYIQRKVRLPGINVKGIKKEHLNQVAFSEQEYETMLRKGTKFNQVSQNKPDGKMTPERTETAQTIFLLLPLKNFTTVDSLVDIDNIYLWSKTSSNQVELEKLNDSPVVISEESFLEVEEAFLLQSNVSFGSGRLQDKLAIIVDYPGKGKSTLLSSLSNLFLKSLSLELKEILVRVNLIDYLGEYPNLTSTKAGVDFLVDRLLGLEASNCLVACIVKQMCLNPGRDAVSLLLDGLDEIDDKRRTATCQMVEQLLLAPGIKRIIIASRPDNGLKHLLERRFQRFLLHLSDFNEEDQRNSLLKQWTHKINEVKRYNSGEMAAEDKKWISRLVNHTIELSKKFLVNDDKFFLGIPLQCFLFSECFFDEIRLYLEAEKKELPPRLVEGKFDILCLYEHFFESKMTTLTRDNAFIEFPDLHNSKRNMILEDLRGTFLDALKRLSVFSMAQQVFDAEVLCRLSWKVYRSKRYIADLKVARRLGFLKEIAEIDERGLNQERPNVKFIHRTFSEYFFALFIAECFKQKTTEFFDDDILAKDRVQEAWKVLTTKILVKTEYAGARRFLDRMLGKDNVLPIVDERCPFAVGVREKVVDECLVIGHVKFNDFLVQPLLCSAEGDSIIHKIFKGEGFFEEKLMSLYSWLAFCIKECVVRMSNANLTVFKTAVVKLLTHFLSTDEYVLSEHAFQSRERLLHNSLQWFDAPEHWDCDRRCTLSSGFCEVYHIATNRQAGNFLCQRNGYSSTHIYLFCRLLKNHSYHSSLKGQLLSTTTLIFGLDDGQLRRGSLLCRNDNIENNDDFKRFEYILRLSSSVFSDSTDLLWRQVTWFTFLLSENKRQKTMCLEHNNDIFYVGKGEFINPSMFTQTACYLIIQLKRQELFAEASKLLKSCIEFIGISLKFSMKTITVLRSTGRAENTLEQELVTLILYIEKSETVILLLETEEGRNNARLSLLFNGSGHELLTEYCNATCRNLTYQAMLNVFERNPDLQEKCKRWSTKALDLVWNGKGESEFIKFLLGCYDTSVIDDDPRGPRMCGKKEIQYLISSEVVQGYIREKLSLKGSNYLMAFIRTMQ